MRLATPVPAIATRFDDAPGGVDLRSPMLEQHLLLGGIVLECLWYLALAGLLCDRTTAIAPSSG